MFEELLTLVAMFLIGVGMASGVLDHGAESSKSLGVVLVVVAAVGMVLVVAFR